MEQAARLSHRQFARALAYWRQRADPDGVEHGARAAHGARRLHLSQSFAGAWVLDATFDPIGGDVLQRALKGIEHELFAADWAEARARVGAEVCGADLVRTPAQRRADAAVEMARRARAVPPGARLPEPLFSVFVGYETFAGRICELADGTVVAPGSLVGWLEDGWVERVVFDAPDRVRNLGARGASSPAPPAAPSRCASGSASTSSATSPPRTARSTTFSRTRPAGRPSRATGASPAATTTGCATDDRSRRSGGGDPEMAPVPRRKMRFL